MSVLEPPWFVRLGERVHPVVLGLGVSLVIGLPFLIGDYSQSDLYQMMRPRQALGTGILFALMPGYLMTTSVYLWRMNERIMGELAPLVPADAVNAAQLVLSGSAWRSIIFVLLGFIFGGFTFANGNFLFLSETSSWHDLWFHAANVVLFGVVGWLLSWRLFSARSLRRLGERLNIDVYDLHALNAFVRVPMLDLLTVMGALALMVLQSIDLEFRWGNYQTGLMVIVPTAMVLLVYPLWGLHRNMRGALDIRLAEIQRLIDQCDRQDLTALGALVAHRETVRNFSSWPLDVGLLGKGLLYLVLPPLAWVAAALVERGVERFVG